jgi:hypothetical protein
MTEGFEVIESNVIGEGDASGGSPLEAPTSRRRLFQMGAVGVATVGAAAVANALSADPASAATGGNMLIGNANAVTAQTNVTALNGGPFAVSNSSTAAKAITGTNAGGPGILGVSSLGGFVGVEGQALGGTAGSIGIKGTGVIGVQGVTDGGATFAGPGVLGVGNATGAGVEAQNAAGASLQLDPFGTSTLPATSSPGQFIVLSDGSLHYSYASNQWVPLTNGIVPIAPVRVINTATGAGGITGPLAAGAAVHTTTAIAGTNGIPLQAIGVVGNFAISGVGGALLNGYGVATIYPAGAATPATANINAGAGCFAISNSVTVGFGTGGNAGKLSIVWGGGGPVPNAQAYFDVTGYIL